MGGVGIRDGEDGGIVIGEEIVNARMHGGIRSRIGEQCEQRLKGLWCLFLSFIVYKLVLRSGGLRGRIPIGSGHREMCCAMLVMGLSRRC